MKRVLPVAAALVTILLLLVGIELIAVGYLYVTEGRYISARDRFGSMTNTFVQGLAADRSDCSYLDTLFPHPYLAFVHHGNPPCGIPDINNIGLFGADFPSRRPDDRFVVLLTGGSVAAQFAQGVAGGPSYLERILDATYHSPNGRPFLVLDGGDGAWKQPQQAILFLLYADAVHAVVTLDGFNEHYHLRSGRRFEYPANNFHVVNPLASQRFGDMAVRWLVGRFRAVAAGNALLSRSHAAYSVIAAADGWARERAESRPAPHTSTESVFALPASWTPAEREAWQIDQYRKYIRSMSALADEHGVLSAHFIQPVPAIGKPLSPEERRVVGDLSYVTVYETMTSALLTLTRREIAVFSLLDVFDGDERTLYGDPIHLLRESDGGSPGYEAMAQRIASHLGDAWRLRPR
jgi:hypothetical protein